MSSSTLCCTVFLYNVFDPQRGLTAEPLLEMEEVNALYSSFLHNFKALMLLKVDVIQIFSKFVLCSRKFTLYYHDWLSTCNIRLRIFASIKNVAHFFREMFCTFTCRNSILNKYYFIFNRKMQKVMEFSIVNTDYRWRQTKCSFADSWLVPFFVCET